MAKFSGKLVILSMNGSLIGESLESELSISQNLIDATTKDSSNWAEHIKGVRTASISVSGLIDYASSFGVDEFADMIVSAQSANFVFATTVATDTSYTGTVDLSDLTQSHANDDVAGWSGTLQVTGTLTKTTVA